MNTIAFDIDGTWTLNPSAWLTIFEFLQGQGFNCIIVTGSDQPQDKLDRLQIPKTATIIVSGSILKEEAARRAGHEVSVWIDDIPGTIQNCRILSGDLDHSETPKSDKIIADLLSANDHVADSTDEELVEAFLDMDADQCIRDTAQAVLEARKYLRTSKP